VKPTSRKRLIVAGATGLALAASSAGAFAGTSTVPVTTAVVNGTRTLHVTDPTGAAIGGTNGLALGAGNGGAFLVNVTDVKYSNVGYQVSATMSDLYPYTSGYDFNATPIHSNRVSVSYPGSLKDLAGIKSLVTPVVNLTGSLNLGDLGLPLGLTAVNQSVNGAVSSVQTLSNTVTSSTYAAALAALPITLQTGTSGAFTNPAGLPGQSGSFTPTSLTLMSGAPGNPLAALLSAVQTTYNGLTAQQLVTAGIIDQNAVLTAAAQALGVTPDAFSAGDITTIMSSLTGTITSLTGGLLGQTGSYNTLPALSINVPAAAAAGLYRGEMVVTLMDN
jgi:hypothetical protein